MDLGMPSVKKFLGMPVRQITAADDITLQECRCDFDVAYHLLPTRRSYVDLDFVFEPFSPTPDVGQALKEWASMRQSQSMTFSSIGDTVICAFCGFVMKPGAHRCHRCNSITADVVPNSRYNRLDALIKYSQVSQRQPYEPVYFYLGLRVVRGLDFLWGFDTWQTSHPLGWICEFCGSANDYKFVDCQRCGSGQLPFSDLLKMDTHCLYCGHELVGELVCPACSDARSGYSIWPPRMNNICQ
jgi:ribosomal protein L40E